MTSTWQELFSEGRTLFYEDGFSEGDGPEGFAKEMREKFGFDPSDGLGWSAQDGWSFHCPPHLLDRIYEQYRLGS